MKNFIRSVFLSIAILLLPMLFCGCNEVAVKDIQIEGLPSEIVSVGEVFELNVVFEPENATDTRVEWWSPQSDLIKMNRATPTMVTVETLNVGRITIFARAKDGNITKSVTFDIIASNLDLKFDEEVNGVISRTYNAVPQQVSVLSVYEGVEYQYFKEGESEPMESLPIDVGRYKVIALVNTPNYYGECETILQIFPQTIEVKADNKEKIYGGSEVAFTRRVIGQIFDEDITISGELSRESGEDAGIYKITQAVQFSVKGERAENYRVKFTEGRYLIKKAPLQVSVTVPTIYYGIAPDNINYNVSGLRFNDSVEDLGINISYPSDMKDVGQYDLVCDATTKNYDLSYSVTKVSVLKSRIELTIDNAEKKYKFDEPNYTYSIYNAKNTLDTTKLFYDDTLDLSFVRNNVEDVGVYEVGAKINNNNYDVVVKKGKLTITPRIIGIKAFDATKRYGQSDPEFSTEFINGEEYDDVVGDEVLRHATREAGENVGVYTITPVGTQARNNYEINYVNADFEITKAKILLRVDDVTIPYKAPDPIFTFTVDENGDQLLSDNNFQFTYSRDEGVDVGNYSVWMNIEKEDDNYELSTESGILTIRERKLYYNIENISINYFQVDETCEVVCELDSTVSDENVENINIYEKADFSLPIYSDVGVYDITGSLKSLIPNYDIQIIGGVLQINQAQISVLVKDKTYYYGEGIIGEYEYASGSDQIPNSPQADEVTAIYEYYDLDGNKIIGYPTTIGNYKLVCNLSQPENKNNYVFTTSSGNLTLVKAEIYVTVNDYEAVYGHEIEKSYRIDKINGGFYEQATIVWDTLDLNVGEHKLDCVLADNEKNKNFKLICTSGNITITPAPVKIILENKQFKYGDDREFTYVFDVDATDDVFLSDTADLIVSLSGDENGIGLHYIICQYSEKDNKSNYAVTVQNAQYEILKREYKLKVCDSTKKYGEPEPNYTYEVLTTSDIILNEDTETIVLNYVRDAGETVGDYVVNATADDGEHYTIAIEPGTLNIIKRVYSIKINDFSKKYGEADPEFNYEVLDQGDDVLPEDADKIELTYTREEGQSVGVYKINANFVGNEHFDLVINEGNLTIVKRNYKIKIKDVTKKYGEIDPVFSYLVLDNGDVVLEEDKDKIILRYIRGNGEDVGEYIVNASFEGNEHFDVEVYEGKLKIIVRQYDFKIKDVTKKYGEADPEFSYEILSSSDEVLEGDSFEIVYTRNEGENCGEYFISGSVKNVSKNYKINVTQGMLTIEKRVVTITAKDVTVYEGDEIVLTYELSGDAIINDDIEFILQSDGGTAGVYDIIVIITKDNNNYEITTTNAKLTILSREE